MRILLDECMPSPLAKVLTGHTVLTTQSMGWASKKNGDLLALAEREFDVFLTSDQNLSYQQNLSNRSIAIVLVPTNRWSILSQKIGLIIGALDQLRPAEFRTVAFD